MITDESLIERVEQLRYRAPREIDALIAEFAIVPTYLKNADLTQPERRGVIIPYIPQKNRNWFLARVDEFTTT